MPTLTLSVLPQTFAVCRLPADAPLGVPGGALTSVTRTSDELSVVCEEPLAPAGARTEGGWAALKLHGPFAFTLTGVLAAVLNPLKDADVGIFAISTFDTDYVLVKRERLHTALRALRADGHTILGDAAVDAAERE